MPLDRHPTEVNKHSGPTGFFSAHADQNQPTKMEGSLPAGRFSRHMPPSSSPTVSQARSAASCGGAVRIECVVRLHRPPVAGASASGGAMGHGSLAASLSSRSDGALLNLTLLCCGQGGQGAEAAMAARGQGGAAWQWSGRSRRCGVSATTWVADAAAGRAVRPYGRAAPCGTRPTAVVRRHTAHRRTGRQPCGGAWGAWGARGEAVWRRHECGILGVGAGAQRWCCSGAAAVLTEEDACLPPLDGDRAV
jgi:hypothetical protein